VGARGFFAEFSSLLASWALRADSRTRLRRNPRRLL
jgi:hypothetical protein